MKIEVAADNDKVTCGS